MMKSFTTINADVLIIGAGGAGLRAAIEAREKGADVLIVSKAPIGRSCNTAISGSAIAAATGLNNVKDGPEVHFRDTLKIGRYINDRNLVNAMTRGAVKQIDDLQKYGVQFAKSGNQYFTLNIPNHSYPRVIKSRQGIGTGMTMPLSRYASSIGVRTIEKIFITKLLLRECVVIGAIGVDLGNAVFVFNSKSVILAAGGLGQIFERSTNVIGATGDGYSLAYNAGAKLMDMEFIQFLPTTLYENTKQLILYEVFVRHGAIFRNSLGENIFAKHHLFQQSEMARDRVSRAIMNEISEGRGINGAVILDLSMISEKSWNELESIRQRSKSLKKLKRKTYYITPSAHFCMGGVTIDDMGKTSVEGLFAAGEVCGGVHGANRLGPNAITEIFVFGMIAGRSAYEYALRAKKKTTAKDEIQQEVNRLNFFFDNKGDLHIDDVCNRLKRTMWQKCGIIRSELSLNGALKDLKNSDEELYRVKVSVARQLWKALELQNMLLISNCIVTSARIRTESRGAHYREDFPTESKEWEKNIIISNSGVQVEKMKHEN